MDISNLKQYPLASLYGWRSALFVTPQGVTDDAAERREIREKVMQVTYEARRAPIEDDFSDIL